MLAEVRCERRFKGVFSAGDQAFTRVRGGNPHRHNRQQGDTRPIRGKRPAITLYRDRPVSVRI
jgi:hypothetical protein